MASKAQVMIRDRACEMAVDILHVQDDPTEVADLWAYASFFEKFMLYGSEGTRAEYGPKDKPSAPVIALAKGSGGAH